jgi:hypothetical protein
MVDERSFIGWFSVPYDIYAEETDKLRTNIRVCAMDNFTSELFSKGENWSELEIDGNQAIVRVRAGQQMLKSLGKKFTSLSETEARSYANAYPKMPQYDDATDSIIFDGPKRKTKDIEDLVKEIPSQSRSEELTKIIGIWAAIGFGLGWRLPQEWWWDLAMKGILPILGGMAFPTTSTLDNFNRSDSGTLGSNWTLLSGTSAQIISNQAAPANNGVFGSNAWNVSTYGEDCEGGFTVVTKGANNEPWSVLLRMTDFPNSDGYWFRFIAVAGTDEWRIRRLDNGSATQLGATMTQELSSGDSIGAESIDDDHKIYYHNGSSWASLGTRVDATYDQVGNIWTYWEDNNSNNVRFDDFFGGTVVSAAIAPTAALDGSLVGPLGGPV